MSSIATEVLATWRELERALGRMPPADQRAAAIAQRIDELRGLYRRLTDTSAQPQVTPAEPRATLARCQELLATLPPPR